MQQKCELAVAQGLAQDVQALLPPSRALGLRRRPAITVVEDEDETEGGEEEPRKARQFQRDLADQVAMRAAERQRIEDQLRAQVEAAEKAAAAAEHPTWRRRRHNERI